MICCLDVKMQSKDYIPKENKNMNEKEYLKHAIDVYNSQIPKLMDEINDKLVELQQLEIERKLIINQLLLNNK